MPVNNGDVKLFAWQKLERRWTFTKWKVGWKGVNPHFFPFLLGIIRVVFNGVKRSKDCMKERNNIQSLHFFFFNFLNISLLLTYTASHIAHMYIQTYMQRQTVMHLAVLWEDTMLFLDWMGKKISQASVQILQQTLQCRIPAAERCSRD